MNTDKTLYITDLDGTLLDGRAELSAFTRGTLCTLIENGLHFTIASARTAATALHIMRGVPLRLPVALMNGAVIYDTAAGRYIHAAAIPEAAVRAVACILRAQKVTGLYYRLRDGELATYYEAEAGPPVRAFMADRERRYGKRFELADDFRDISARDAVYFTLLDTYERLCPVNEALLGLSGVSVSLYRDIYSEDLWYLELFSAEASKRTAVTYMRETFGYTHISCFGGNLNDLPMFEAADTRIAVANARPELMAAADIVCGANTEDGVARYLLNAAGRI